MANILNIEINEQQIDLFPGEIFTLTLQAVDLINLTGVKSDFSKTIEIPASENNSQILGIVQEITSQSVTPYRQLKTKVIQNGTEIIPSGITIVESTTGKNTFKITIYSGNINISDIL
ncbi:unnamed protein product, partial [marine sediment metagenome]